ncbi:MAG TPA: hypothetical protein PLY31_10555, partial [Tenuifilaceae bacterium]|nr:hypothetical protein [Tenuifilaceae bacterium]
DDLEFLMGWTTSKVNSSRQYSINFDKFSADEQKILNFLKEKGEETVDVIAMDTGLQVSKVLSLLLNLEFAGVVRSMPGKVFALAIG